MAESWTPNQIQRMMVCTTGCLCMVMFVAGTLWLVAKGIVGPTQLGIVSGTGMLGIGALVLAILKIAIKA